jgi:hypothetical protein
VQAEEQGTNDKDVDWAISDKQVHAVRAEKTVGMSLHRKNSGSNAWNEQEGTGSQTPSEVH